MKMTTKRTLAYTTMPQIMPRLQTLFSSGFQHVAYFMALVYHAVRLLPANHPYINTRNIGSFGLRHVIAEAANNLVIARKNIDQIIVFIAIITGVVIIFLQFFMVGFSLFSKSVTAQDMPSNFSEFFIAPNQEDDLAYMMMDMVFGVEDMFESCVSTGGPCKNITGKDIVDEDAQWILQELDFPFPIHDGLHAMFRLYSIALLVVAAMITAYFIFTIIAETAQTGTAFGKRFNRVWAPIRLVVAFGLLVPIGPGINSAQYIVLYAAKYGSGFASNGWRIFNEGLSSSTYLQKEQLISEPNIPELNALLQFLYATSVCWELNEMQNRSDNTGLQYPEIKAYMVTGNVTATSATEFDGDYDTLIDFADGDNQVIIRFGPPPNKEQFPLYKGYVKPVCGELVFPLTDPRKESATNPPEEGIVTLQRKYIELVEEIWFEEFFVNGQAGNIAKHYTQWEQEEGATAQLPEADYRRQTQEKYRNQIDQAIKEAVDQQRESAAWDIDVNLRNKGWAAAGIWYNRIAQLNGEITTAALNIPMPTQYPDVMEHVAIRKSQQDANLSSANRFEPVMSSGEDIFPSKPEDTQMAKALWAGYEFWQADGHATSTHTAITGNAFTDFIKFITGTEGLYNMRKNRDVHPLAQIVGIGRSLVESTIRNVGFSTILAGLGAFSQVEAAQSGASGGIGILMTLSTVALTAGFVMFYVIPFLPFIYFFFAVGGWIKGIFEAMVGAPLWALAHIRIDGDGLAGQAAVNGYFLIFEIFLRPILIVFGLLASVSIYAALVSVLNDTWDIVTENLTGFDARAAAEGGESLTEFFRSPVDQFFFTVLYAIIVYMMGMSSFKLIDLIPNNILRWMGQAITTFNDEREEVAQGLVGTASLGAQQAVSSIGGGLKQGLQAGAKIGS